MRIGGVTSCIDVFASMGPTPLCVMPYTEKKGLASDAGRVAFQ